MTEQTTESHPTREFLLRLYRTQRTIRTFAERGIAEYRAGRIRGYFHPYIGQEAIAAGACAALRREDYITSTHRGHGHCIAKGADLGRMMAELFGRKTGYSKGRGGSMHIADRSHGNLGANGIVGGGIPLATGAALGVKIEESDNVVVCFFGDGAANNGVLAECMNMAAVYHLPVIYLLENNCYAAATHVSEVAACDSFADRARGYGLPGVSVFGNDAVTVFDTVTSAVARARAGNGASFVECRTHRILGHHVNDTAEYMDEAVISEWKDRDPMLLLARRLSEAGVTGDELSDIDRWVAEAVDAAVVYAERAPEADPAEFLNDIAGYDE
jgi:acetoin:2,6-dichlorophenolindophenol oxidoreductase subunit alpha